MNYDDLLVHVEVGDTLSFGDGAIDCRITGRTGDSLLAEVLVDQAGLAGGVVDILTCGTQGGGHAADVDDRATLAAMLGTHAPNRFAGT